MKSRKLTFWVLVGDGINRLQKNLQHYFVSYGVLTDSIIGPGAVNIGPREFGMVRKDADCQCAQDSTFRILKLNIVFELGQF